MRQKIDKRKAAGKDSDVYVDGVLMPPKRLRKEISRQGYMSTMEEKLWAQSQGIRCPKLIL